QPALPPALVPPPGRSLTRGAGAASPPSLILCPSCTFPPVTAPGGQRAGRSARRAVSAPGGQRAGRSARRAVSGQDRSAGAVDDLLERGHVLLERGAAASTFRQGKYLLSRIASRN